MGLAEPLREAPRRQRDIDTKCMVLADILVDSNKFFDIAEQLYNASLSVRCLQMYEVPTGYDMAIDGTEKFALCCSKLATLLERTGRYDKAEKYRREVLAIYRDLTDEFISGYDEEVAACCENLADLLLKMNRFDEAEILRKEAQEIRQRLVMR